jgi:hypothetical protein
LVRDRPHPGERFAWVYAAHGLVHAYMLVLPSVLVLILVEFAAFLLGGAAVTLMSGLRGWGLVAVGALFSLLLFSCQPMGNALLAILTPRGRRGLAYGVGFTLSFGVGSLANASLGYVADHRGLASVFAGLGLATIPGFLAAAGLALGVGSGRDRLSDVHPMEVRRR